MTTRSLVSIVDDDESVRESLPDLVLDVERTLGLDVETAARRGPTGRANLDRFIDVAAEFAASGESPTLSAFLAYLDAAETAERGLRPGEVEVVGDVVQLLTVHGAKGLEWDAVFVVGLVDGVFPAGHALQSHLISKCLHKAGWAADQPQLLFELSKRMADNRVVAGVHYPIDCEAGRVAADEIFALLSNPAKCPKFNRLMTKRAHDETRPKPPEREL